MLKMPKISCLMVTTGRLPLVRRSVACYIKQTYPYKELIVLSQGPPEVNAEMRAELLAIKRPDIQLVEAPSFLSLGAMRNLSIELSTGTILCQWDDDDFHHPLRLATQYRALSQDGVSASLYMEHLKYFEDTGELYWIDWSVELGEDRRYLPGTIMFPKSAFYKADNMLYPEGGAQSRREEDWSLLKHFCAQGRIAPVREGYQYIYTYHGANTYWREHHGYALQKRVYNSGELWEHKELLWRAIGECGIDVPVKVRSLDEVAFTFEPYNFCSEKAQAL